MNSMGNRGGLFMVGVGVLVAGCGGVGEDAGGEEVGTAMLEISTVPAGAQCLQVVGTGASAFSVVAALTPGSNSANVSLGRLPLGASTVNANVYDVACASIGGVLPSWVAEPQSVTFRAGVITSLVLNLRQNNTVSATANFVGNVVSMTAGYSSTGLVLADGSVRTTGSWSPLAGAMVFSNASSLTGIVELHAKRIYNTHACARNATQVLCWGSQNPNGQLGPGIAVGTGSSSPVVVTGVTGIKELAVGSAHTCALQTGGSVLCWGLNSSGELGNGTTTSSASAVTVSGLAASSDLLVAGYSFTCANSYTGVSCWGANSSGQLGDGTTTFRATATSIGLKGTVSISAGQAHVCAVRADGTARCWGSNSYGQLGDGTTTVRLSPTPVSGITDAVEVAAGNDHTCYRRAGGTVSCVGRNNYGSLGDGTATDRYTVATVPGVTGAVALASGLGHTCALLENRTVTCWGWDLDGQCGDGIVGNNFKPAPAIIQ
jgi:alpha-tubulin suppressor-like RCC1 family protein